MIFAHLEVGLSIFVISPCSSVSNVVLIALSGTNIPRLLIFCQVSLNMKLSFIQSSAAPATGKRFSAEAKKYHNIY